MHLPDYPLLHHPWAPLPPKEKVCQVTRLFSWEDFLATCQVTHGNLDREWALWQLAYWVGISFCTYSAIVATSWNLMFVPVILVLARWSWEMGVWPPRWRLWEGWASAAESGPSDITLLSEQGIWSASPEMVQQIAWSFYSGYRREGELLLLIYGEEVQGHFTKSMFSTDEEWRRAEDLVAAHLANLDQGESAPAASDSLAKLPAFPWPTPVTAGEEPKELGHRQRWTVIDVGPLPREDAQEAYDLHYAAEGRNWFIWGLVLAAGYAALAWFTLSVAFGLVAAVIVAWCLWYRSQFAPIHFGPLERPMSPYHQPYQFGFCDEGICMRGEHLHSLLAWERFGSCIVGNTHLVIFLDDPVRSWVFPRALARTPSDANTMLDLVTGHLGVFSRE